MFGPQWLTILIYLFLCEHKLNYKRIFLQKLKWHNQGLCCTYSHSILFRAVPSMCSVISFQNADKEIRADGGGRDSSARQPSQQRSLLKARGRGASMLLCVTGGRGEGGLRTAQLSIRTTIQHTPIPWSFLNIWPCTWRWYTTKWIIYQWESESGLGQIAEFGFLEIWPIFQVK